MKDPRIVVTGTPGTGKTTISKILREKTGYLYVNTSKIALQKEHVTAYDYSRKTYIIDEEKLGQDINALLKKTKKGVIIETIYPCIIDSENIDYLVVLKTEPQILMERLGDRGNWPYKKISENVETEFMNSILNEIRECHPQKKIIIIDATNRTPEEIVKIILNLIGKKN
jgi:adenylate kinase